MSNETACPAKDITVLVLESSKPVADFYHSYFQNRGCEAVQCSNGDEVKSAISSARPEHKFVILNDIHANGGGTELYYWIRHLKRDYPILFVVNSCHPLEMEEIEKILNKDLRTAKIYKPFNPLDTIDGSLKEIIRAYGNI